MSSPSGTFQIEAIGYVDSPLRDRGDAPKQGFEGSPRAWLVFDAAFTDALADLKVGDEIIVLTWLDRAERNILKVHPRDDTRNPLTGVFSTRSQDRRIPLVSIACASFPSPVSRELRLRISKRCT